MLQLTWDMLGCNNQLAGEGTVSFRKRVTPDICNSELSKWKLWLKL